MLSLGQPPALAAAPMRSPALPTVPPYDDSRADADSPAVRSLWAYPWAPPRISHGSCGCCAQQSPAATVCLHAQSQTF